MAKQLSDIKKLIERGETDTAINALTNFIGNHQGSKDEAYYLLGNAYRKKGDWQQALNNYLEAIERNPESPAVQAHRCNCSRHRTLQRLQSLRSGMSATCNIAHRQRSE